MNKSKMEQIIKEVEKKMNKSNKNTMAHKGLWIGIGVAVVATLVGIVLWLKSKNDEYIEEYYEYFDDDLEDEVEEDLYGDAEEEVGYVEIKNFAEEADQEEAQELLEEVTEAEEVEEVAETEEIVEEEKEDSSK